MICGSTVTDYNFFECSHLHQLSLEKRLQKKNFFFTVHLMKVLFSLESEPWALGNQLPTQHPPWLSAETKTHWRTEEQEKDNPEPGLKLLSNVPFGGIS